MKQWELDNLPLSVINEIKRLQSRDRMTFIQVIRRYGLDYLYELADESYENKLLSRHKSLSPKKRGKIRNFKLDSDKSHARKRAGYKYITTKLPNKTISIKDTDSGNISR